MKLTWEKIRKLLQSTKDLQRLGIANVLSKAIAGIFWLYIAILLGTENYGQVSYFVAIGAMAASLSMIGAPNTIIVYAAKKVPIQPAIYFITLILGTIAAVIVTLIYDSYEVGIFVIGYVIFNLAIADLLGRKNYKQYSKFFILQKIVFVGLAIGFYFIFGYMGIVLGYALSFFIFTYLIIKEFKENKLDFSLLKSKLGFMMNSYALSIERIFNGQVDKIIIAPMFGFSILGNFSLSLQFFSLLAILPGVVYQYTLSQEASGNPSILIKKLSIISSLIFAVLGFFLSPIIIPWMFPQFTEAIQIVQIISFLIIPYSFNLSYTSKFLGGERARIILVGQAVSLTTYIVGLFTLGEIIGINGVAFALLLSGIAQTIFYYSTNRFFMNSKIFKPTNDNYF